MNLLRGEGLYSSKGPVSENPPLCRERSLPAVAYPFRAAAARRQAVWLPARAHRAPAV